MKKSRKKLTVPAQKTLNPFEMHINKQKVSILGQKSKNDRGLPGISRAKALKNRKDTLLKEYKVQHKSNKFLDKRIGEWDRNMTTDDKLTARFTAVRKKAQKKSLFNLADDEVLTHKGQTLTEIEKFDDPRSDDEESLDEDRSGKLERDFVEEAHFGGGILKKTGQEGAKTHRELIDELIAESKKRKAEKQKTKEATLELTEKLDKEWSDLLPLVNKNHKKEQNMEKPAIDDYDKVMRELKFESRGTVSDRLKSESEKMQEEKEHLEELEKERQMRMKGFQEKERRHRSADDLDDDLVYEADQEYMLSYNAEGESNVEIEAQLDGKNITGNAEEDQDGEKEHDVDNESEDDDDDENEDDDDNNEDDLSDLKADTSEESDQEEEQEIVAKADIPVQEGIHIAEEELPSSYSVPASYEDLQKLLDDNPIKHRDIIIERIIKHNDPSLGEKNKNNLKLFFAYLLQYLNDSTSDLNTKSFETFQILAPHLFDLAQLDKVNALNSMREVLKEKQEDFRKHKSKFPGFEVLFILKLISLLFPTSDFKHQVVTPSLVFMEQMLSSCKVKSRRDISYGLFLVTLALEYTTLSKRLFPSAIKYLGGILHMAIPKVGVKLIKVTLPFKPVSSQLVLVNDCTDMDVKMKMQVTDLTEKQVDDSFKIRVIYTALKLVQEFDNNLSSLPSNVQIFKDIVVYMELLPTRNYPQVVKLQFDETLAQIKNRWNDKKLDYIVTAAKKPKALRLYEPKIEEVFDCKMRRMHSKEKAERSKLMYKLKQETKGAMREIRKDRDFLGRVKIHQRIRSDKERKDRVKRIFSEAAMQQSELNSLDRSKKRKT